MAPGQDSLAQQYSLFSGGEVGSYAVSSTAAHKSLTRYSQQAGRVSKNAAVLRSYGEERLATSQALHQLYFLSSSRDAKWGSCDEIFPGYSRSPSLGLPEATRLGWRTGGGGGGGGSGTIAVLGGLVGLPPPRCMLCLRQRTELRCSISFMLHSCYIVTELVHRARWISRIEEFRRTEGLRHPEATSITAPAAPKQCSPSRDRRPLVPDVGAHRIMPTRSLLQQRNTRAGTTALLQTRRRPVWTKKVTDEKFLAPQNSLLGAMTACWREPGFAPALASTCTPDNSL